MTQRTTSEECFLQRIWRPIVMLMFAAMIFARWFGWAPDHLSEAEAAEILSIIKVGLGIYTGGRSAEKVMKILKGRS